MVRIAIVICPACGRPLIEWEACGMLAVHVRDEREDPVTGVRTGRCPDKRCNRYVRWDHPVVVRAIIAKRNFVGLHVVLDKRGVRSVD
jgi:hypothetical protein